MNSANTSMVLTDGGVLTVNVQQTPGGSVQTLFSNNVNNPVVGYDVTGVSYDLAHPTITASEQITAVVVTNEQNAIVAVFPDLLSFQHTDTSSHMFSISEAVQLASKTTFDAKFPVLGEPKEK